MYFTQFQDFDPLGKSKTCKNASFDCTSISLTLVCLCNMIVYFTIVCQMNIMSTDKITKPFVVNANLVPLLTIGHSKK